jgi:hypothetical protein
VTVLNRTSQGAPDENANGIPDGCEPHFHRGDVDGDGSMTIGDAGRVLAYVLSGADAPACLAAADANGDRLVDLSDGIFVLNFLFREGAPPPSPGPPTAECGIEPAAAISRDPLGCERYEGC